MLLLVALLLLGSYLPVSTNEDTGELATRERRSLSQEEKLRRDLATLARQLKLQQFYVEETSRSSGASGLKRIRLNKQGSRPYLTPTYGDQNFAAMHDHANYKTTIGLGELIVVLNGVEFRTRHLDYKMRMKSKTQTRYGLMEDIPYPEVPPEVLNKGKPSEQIAEMQEWFRAFKEQDTKIRDYKKYFRPVLCYMEGMWTNSDQYSIEESFDSDRHHLDAKSWMDMQEKTRFTALTGSKDILENYAYLPTTVMDSGDKGAIAMAQWNFKISCHPIKGDVPLNRLLVVEDIKARVSEGLTWSDYYNSRAARYRVSPLDKSKLIEKVYKRMYLDDLMEEIPGMDNYPAHLKDDALGDMAYPWYITDDTPKNVGYFHRWYRSKQAGAMGLLYRHRSFGDENIFMAMNSQDKVAGVHVERCTDPDDKDSCKTWTQKWSYAIPLEIIYLTPLTKWNPYKIKYKGKWNSADGKTVRAGANGETAGQAYNGINDQLYYMTPTEFFGGEVGNDPADTVRSFIYTKDAKGTPRQVSASGHRVLWNITGGVGIIRQRYPIVPLHEEGTSTWKNMEALMDVVLEPEKYKHLLRGATNDGSSSSGGSTSSAKDKSATDDKEKETTTGATTANSAASYAAFKAKIASLIKNEDDVVLKLGASTATTLKTHVHYVVLTKEQIKAINGGAKVPVTTDEAEGHTHDLTINVTIRKDAAGKDVFLYNAYRCDGGKGCPGGHLKRLEQVYPEK